MAQKRLTGLCLKLNEREAEMLRIVADRDGMSKSEWLRLQIILTYRAMEE